MSLQTLLQPEWEKREEYYRFARGRGFGLEIISFALVGVLNESATMEEHLDAYERELSTFSRKTLHGPFVDITPHSPDRLIADVSRQRIVTALQIASRLGASHLVLHTGINWQIRNPGYLDRAVGVQAEFWSGVLDRFPEVTVCLENMFEPDPGALRRILGLAGHPRLKVCFDVGHAHVFGMSAPQAWLEELADAVVYLHLNDNHGDRDSELALGRGTIGWKSFFEEVRGMPNPLLTTLEVNSLEAVAESVAFLAREGMIESGGSRIGG